nr:pre-toxin TG domain-containing protein [Enterococcus sp. BWB1-3]
MIILTVIPVTAPLGVVLGTTLAVGSVSNAVTGEDWLTGRELSTTERVVEGVFGTIGAASGLGSVAKQAVGTGLVDDVVKLVTPSASVADDVVKAAVDSGKTTTGTKPPLKMDLQFFADKGDDVVAESTKAIYRGVGADEYYDIMETGQFRPNPNGQSLEAKQFGNNYDEVLDFSDKTMNKDISAIVEVKIPQSTYDNLNPIQLDPGIFKSGTVTVEPGMLDDFNKSIIEINHKF